MVKIHYVQVGAYLVKLFNRLFTLGHFPSDWSNGLIVSLHMKGSIHDFHNYRGTGSTLLPTLGKLFTTVLNTRLTKWVEDYVIYLDSQGGFRKGLGISDSIFVLHNLVN